MNVRVLESSYQKSIEKKSIRSQEKISLNHKVNDGEIYNIVNFKNSFLWNKLQLSLFGIICWPWIPRETLDEISHSFKLV